MQAWLRVRDFLTSRWFIKTAFFVYFIFACVQLMRFAAWTRGTGPYVGRPEAPAGLLPVGHFTSFFGMVRGGGWDTLLPAGLVIIIGALAVSLLFKRGFCGWICPLGTLWEAFALGGRKLMGKNIRIPRWLDITGQGVPLRAHRADRRHAVLRRPGGRGGRLQVASRTCGSPTSRPSR